MTNLSQNILALTDAIGTDFKATSSSIQSLSTSTSSSLELKASKSYVDQQDAELQSQISNLTGDVQTYLAPINSSVASLSTSTSSVVMDVIDYVDSMSASTSTGLITVDSAVASLSTSTSTALSTSLINSVSNVNSSVASLSTSTSTSLFNVDSYVSSLSTSTSTALSTVNSDIDSISSSTSSSLVNVLSGTSSSIASLSTYTSSVLSETTSIITSLSTSTSTMISASVNELTIVNSIIALLSTSTSTGLSTTDSTVSIISTASSSVNSAVASLSTVTSTALSTTDSRMSILNTSTISNSSIISSLSSSTSAALSTVDGAVASLNTSSSTGLSNMSSAVASLSTSTSSSISDVESNVLYLSTSTSTGLVSTNSVVASLSTSTSTALSTTNSTVASLSPPGIGTQWYATTFGKQVNQTITSPSTVSLASLLSDADWKSLLSDSNRVSVSGGAFRISPISGNTKETIKIRVRLNLTFGGNAGDDKELSVQLTRADGTSLGALSLVKVDDNVIKPNDRFFEGSTWAAGLTDLFYTQGFDIKILHYSTQNLIINNVVDSVQVHFERRPEFIPVAVVPTPFALDSSVNSSATNVGANSLAVKLTNDRIDTIINNGAPRFKCPSFTVPRFGDELSAPHQIIPAFAVVNPTYVGFSPTLVGTNSAPAPSSTNALSAMTRFRTTSAAVVNSAVYSRNNNTAYLSNGAIGGFYHTFNFGISDTAPVAGARLFIGVRPDAAVPTNVEPSTLRNQIGVGHGAADTTLKMYLGGAAAMQVIDLGANFPIGNTGNAYRLIVYNPNSTLDTNVGIGWCVQRLGTTFQAHGFATLTSIGLSGNIGFTPYWHRQNNATALAVSLDIGSVYMQPFI